MKRQLIIAYCLLIVGGGLGTFLRYSDREPDRLADFGRLPAAVEKYTGVELEIDKITLDVLQAAATTERSYNDSRGYTYNLFVGYFKSQKFGSSIHSPKHCLPGGGWRINRHETRSIEFQDGITRDVNLLTIGYSGQNSVMLYWFETRAGATRSEYGLKFDLFTNALLFRPTDAAFIRMTVVVPDGDIAAAIERTVDFARSIQPGLANALPF